LPATATPTARHVTWIGIGGFQRTATTRHTAPMARFIIGVGIGFTAAALFGARLVFAR
jgi:hypothetical protein